MLNTKKVEANFEERLNAGLEIIKNSSIQFEQVGIFGSYARGDHKGSSDIDLCFVTKNTPNQKEKAILKADLDDLNIDCTFVSEESFSNEQSKFFVNLRKDYRRVL